MFLNSLIRKNKKFIETAIKLHQEGKIPANTYVLDLDTIHENAKIIKAEADKHGMKVFAMTKQLGRNAALINTLKKAGIDACVAVDMAGARASYEADFSIGHIGHLVQVPKHEALSCAKMYPEYWTVFSKEKAKEASEANKQIGRTQKVLVRIYEDENDFYRGHEGGVNTNDLKSTVEYIDSLDNLEFAGITTFPALLFDNEKRKVLPTKNLETLRKAKEILDKMGIKNIEVNAPGTTSSKVLDILAQAGATQIEPGHGLTGTTPLHCVEDLQEQPAVLYMSEVSHEYKGEQFCFGGGLYIDPVFPDYEVAALVGSDAEIALNQKVICDIPDSSSIDYYGMLQSGKKQKIKPGDSVVFGFRIQAFVTRGYVAAISGVHNGEPKVEGIYFADGTKKQWP